MADDQIARWARGARGRYAWRQWRLLARAPRLTRGLEENVPIVWRPRVWRVSAVRGHVAPRGAGTRPRPRMRRTTVSHAEMAAQCASSKKGRGPGGRGGVRGYTVGRAEPPANGRTSVVVARPGGPGAPGPGPRGARGPGPGGGPVTGGPGPGPCDLYRLSLQVSSLGPAQGPDPAPGSRARGPGLTTLCEIERIPGPWHLLPSCEIYYPLRNLNLLCMWIGFGLDSPETNWHFYIRCAPNQCS